MSCGYDAYFTKDIDSKQNHNNNIISKTHNQNQRAIPKL